MLITRVTLWVSKGVVIMGLIKNFARGTLWVSMFWVRLRFRDSLQDF